MRSTENYCNTGRRFIEQIRKISDLLIDVCYNYNCFKFYLTA